MLSIKVINNFGFEYGLKLNSNVNDAIIDGITADSIFIWFVCCNDKLFMLQF